MQKQILIATLLAACGSSNLVIDAKLDSEFPKDSDIDTVIIAPTDAPPDAPFVASCAVSVFKSGTLIDITIRFITCSDPTRELLLTVNAFGPSTTVLHFSTVTLCSASTRINGNVSTPINSVVASAQIDGGASSIDCM